MENLHIREWAAHIVALGMLHSVAVCCGVLRRVAVCCGVLQCITVYCIVCVMQFVAVC